jgi:hypothetical protein
MPKIEAVDANVVALSVLFAGALEAADPSGTALRRFQEELACMLYLAGSTRIENDATRIVDGILHEITGFASMRAIAINRKEIHEWLKLCW